ncbi:HAD family hydrolase [Mesorhizobium loti]|uniref:HAD family hydrolase n=1 Tax=Rhizobium loti TaxID=381 RepID=UPI00047D181D|nr:HAD family hydrolase [Mesorhizobium loti]
MRVRAVLFDVDGTLVDSNELHVQAWAEAFASIGIKFQLPVIHDEIGKGADMLIPALAPDLDSERRQSIGKLQGEIFRKKFLRSVRPFPRARDILVHACQHGQKVALASSAPEDDLDHYLDLLAARDLVTVTTSSSDVARTKPAPDIFSTALAKLPGVAASEAVVVGDTPYDVEAANKIGIATVAVRSGGFSDMVLERAGASAIYDDVAALLEDYRYSPLGH